MSGSNQEDNSSLATQEAGCRRYAAEHGWSVVEVYREVHTGADLFERPQLSLLRESMRRREFDVLLVHALDRLSRRQIHQGLILSEAEHAGVEWDSVLEDIDNSPQGQILRAVIGGMAEMERVKILERTQRGIRARVESGKLLAGPRPLYGYQWSDPAKSRLIVVPEKARVVERIYAEFLAGKSLRAISSGLALDGVPTPTGKLGRWPIPTISSILTNPAYTGHAVAFRHRVEHEVGQGRRVVIRAEVDQFTLPEGTVPALVTTADQEAAVARLAHNRQTSKRNNRHPEATLLRAGLVRCGYCDRALVADHPSANQPRSIYYQCNGKFRGEHNGPQIGIAAGPLDAAVWARVQEVLLHPELIAAEVERRRGTDTIASDLAAVDRRIAAIERQRSNLIRSLALLDDEESVRVMTRELSALSAQIIELNADRHELQARQMSDAADNEQLLSIANWCTRAATNLAYLTYTERRMVLEALGVSVRVWSTDHDPRWELTMAPLPCLPDAPIKLRTPTGRCRGRRPLRGSGQS